MAVTAERVVDVVKLFAPLVVGVLLIVVGVWQSSWGTFGAGAGLLGIPGLSEALKGQKGATDAGPTAAQP